MLSREMYTAEYIAELHERTGNDPALLERVIFAFGLLEAIRKVGLSFCFKGGTSLMLLLDHPRRLSTDIDIIVAPGTDIDDYIRKAGEIFPFKDVEESIRAGQNNIEKRHFRFTYYSPCSRRDVTILLDILIEDILYSTLIERPIRNGLLLTEGDDLSVVIPDANGLLGDKLTAFAPHSTGIQFGIGKELEIIKQLFDCGVLFDAMGNLAEVRRTYNRIVKSEMAYRGICSSPEKVLEDTLRGALCIASRGKYFREDYAYYRDGIMRIRNHIIGEKFSCEVAGKYAGRVMYLVSAMLVGLDDVISTSDSSLYASHEIDIPNPRVFSYLRYIDPASYRYIAEAFRLLQDIDSHVFTL